MNFLKILEEKEFQRDIKSLMIGVFGGLVASFFFFSYAIFEDTPLLYRILAPTISLLIIFIIMVFVIAYLHIKSKRKWRKRT